MDKSNKIAIVTGASKGIGKAVARKFLDAGYTVIGLGRTAPDFRSEAFKFIPTDIQKESAVAEAFTEILAQFGRMDVLINNAGVGFEGNLENTTSAQWHAMFDTNVHGVFYCCKNVIPQMRKQQSGHIVNIASIAANTGIGGMAGYCATKYAVKGLGHSLFKEVRKDGIKVSTVYPGSTNTNFFDEIESVTANPNMLNPEDIAQSIIEIVQTSANYLPVDLEIRPLKPKG